MTAGTPEAAKSQVENPRTEKCVYTGKVLLYEEGIPVEKVEVLPRCRKFNAELRDRPVSGAPETEKGN